MFKKKNPTGPASVERLRGRSLFLQPKAVVASVQAPPPDSVEFTKAIAEQQARDAEERRAKLAKDATRKRANRKLRADQKAAIKKALKTPVAEIRAAGEACEKAIKRPGSMNAGRFMTDAPTGKGELVTGGYGWNKIDAIFAVKSSNSSGDNEKFWPETDRAKIQPEGVGAKKFEKPPEGTAESDDAVEQSARFRVRLNGFDSYAMFEEIFETYFVEVPSDKGCTYVCRLCGAPFDYKRWSKGHIETVHGDELDPQHDERFGNVLLLYIEKENKRERKRARLEKAGRENALAVAADARATAESEAAKAGYRKLNGEWIIPDSRTA